MADEKVGKWVVTVFPCAKGSAMYVYNERDFRGGGVGRKVEQTFNGEWAGLPLNEFGFDGAKVGRGEIGGWYGAAGVTEFGSEAKLLGMSAGLGEPDPGGMFAVRAEAGDEGGTEVDGRRLRFRVEGYPDYRIMRADSGGSDQVSVGCEVKSTSAE